MNVNTNTEPIKIRCHSLALTQTTQINRRSFALVLALLARGAKVREVSADEGEEHSEHLQPERPDHTTTTVST